MFPPPVLDVRTYEQIVGPDPLQGCRKDPTPPSKPPARYARRAALAGAVAGICLGAVVKVGVFAHARPQPTQVSAEALANAPETPWAVLTDIPAPPPVQDLGEIPVQVVVASPARKLFANPPPQGYKCHGEIMEGGRAVRVCRPDSLAASPIARRSLK